MPVFISHRTIDDLRAKILMLDLMIRDVPCYLDHVDDEAQDTDEITDLLVDRIHQCTHLMALMTINTKGSWWVPFEIGVAREAGRRISTYNKMTGDLPEYLQEWPILETKADLDKFAEAYHRDKKDNRLVEHMEARASLTSSAEAFHSQLKRSLGQQ